MKASAYFTEKNIYGAWVVYGSAGVKQYYGYTKAQAIKLYKNSKKKVVTS